LKQTNVGRFKLVVVLPTPSEEWERGGTPWRPNSRATPHGLDKSSKMEEVVPKMARRRGSDAGLSRRRWIRSCRGCPHL